MRAVLTDLAIIALCGALCLGTLALGMAWAGPHIKAYGTHWRANHKTI